MPQPSQSRPDVRPTPRSQRLGEPRFLDQVANACRVKHLAYRTEQSYVSWVKRFILFHHKRHPQEMGPTEVRAFLTHLAVNRRVAASTQNQALNGVEFDGNAAGIQLGTSLAMGDVNKDGYSDVISGAPQNSSKASYILFGNKCGGSYTACTTPLLLDSTFLNGVNGIELDGVGSSDHTGYNLAVGDIDGNGIPDIAIGALSASPGGNSNAGEVYVYFGKKTNWPTAAFGLGGL